MTLTKCGAFLLVLVASVSAQSNFIHTKDPLDHPFYKDVIAKISQNASAVDIESRIIGGQVAQAGQFPYTVGLHMRTMLTVFVCGGSLIKFNWVLTAAHCIYDFNRITVMLGTINRIRGPFPFSSDVTNSRHIISHPQYSPSTLENDIGLIFLADTLESILDHQFIGTIALPLPTDASVNLVGGMSTVSGFGTTTDGPNRQPSEVLRFVSMPVMSNAVCSQTFGTFVRDSNLCTDTRGGLSPCSGDSGGPLTLEIEPGRVVVVGVVSFGHIQGCGYEFPAVFARVTSFVGWIEDVMETGGGRMMQGGWVMLIVLMFFVMKF